MDKITLGQLLQYYDMQRDVRELVQVVFNGQEWDDAEELYADSEFLKPLYGYTVIALRCEQSYELCLPVLRVMIEKGEKENGYRLEKKADFPEVLGGGLQLCCNADCCPGWHGTGGRTGDRADYGRGNCYRLYHQRRAG